MMIKLILFICLLMSTLNPSNLIAQDTLIEKKNSSYFAPKKKVTEFMVSGSLLIFGSILSGSIIEREFQNNFKNDFGFSKNIDIPLESFIRFVPIIQMYTADLFGLESRNHWFDQSKYLMISNIITSGLTLAGKRIFNKERPNGFGYSFPSGHTSISFTNASVLFEEFRNTSPVFAYTGFAISSFAGSLRIINNEHWLSDVLVGAGLGILVTKLVYYLEPLKNWNPFIRNKDVSFMPSFNGRQVGIFFRMSF